MIEILRTKLFIPRPRKNLVARPRLVDCLNEGLDKKLTLIAAPAGSGKTTLLSEWIPQSPRCVTWFSLDEADNDLIRFWTYFISSLQSLHPDFGESALKLLQSPQAPYIPSILVSLINEITAFEVEFVSVLDDYHLIASQVIHESLTHLIAQLPNNMHLIVATRADPPLPLARFRARDQLTEIRAKNLRFTVDETKSFFNQETGDSLTTEEAAILDERVEGWITGLKIAALSMQGREDSSEFVRTFSGSHRHILGYLVDEVISQRPTGTMDFLLQTSILDRLCGQLCDTVTEGSNGQVTLENLEHANLFITPLDDENKWYRYHHLFAEVLQSRLSQAHPEWVPELYRRASDWFEGKGFFPEAIEYALRGRNWVHAIPLIESNIQEAKKRGEMATVLRWLGALPDEAIHSHPLLGLTHALLLVEVDEFSQAERRLAATEQAFRSDPTWDTDEQTALLGQVALVRETSALMQEYPGEVTIAAGREALALLPESDFARRAYALLILGCAQYISLGEMQTAERSFEDAIRLSQSAGDAFIELMIRSHIIGLRVIQGRLRAAAISTDELLSLAGQPGWEHIPAAGIGRVWGSPVLYEHNDLAGALEMLTQGIAEVESHSLKRPAIIGSIRLVRLKLALGEWDEAHELMERTWETIQTHHLKQIMAPAAAYRARLFLQMNEPEKAMQWAATIELSTMEPLDPALECDHITLARVQLVSGRVKECQQLLARLQPPAEAAGRMSRVIEILALKSVVAFAQRNEDEAVATLHRALVLAEPEGFIRSFVDEGEPMHRLLLDYQSITKKKFGDRVDSEDGRLLRYTDRLLAAFSPPAVLEKRKQGPAREPLSEREQIVLRLIAAGRSNQEIADLLVIAVSTVKSHINNLYGKLGTNRRTEAIAIARDLGLISE